MDIAQSEKTGQVGTSRRGMNGRFCMYETSDKIYYVNYGEGAGGRTLPVPPQCPPTNLSSITPQPLLAGPVQPLGHRKYPQHSGISYSRSLLAANPLLSCWHFPSVR